MPLTLLLFLALLPAAILLIYIYNKDKVEKEPLKLLMTLFFFGGLTIVTACIIEIVLSIPLKILIGDGTFPYIVIENFLIVALAEEAGKFFVLKTNTWHCPQFNYTFDAVVYAVAVSLGFAAFENVIYVLSGTLGTAVMRGILAVPGHAIDGVFMGCYYGIARKCRGFGDEEGAKKNLAKALIVPVLTHGFYDFCIDITSRSGIFFLVFLAFEVVITIIAIKTVNKLSREDEALDYYNPVDPFQ